MARKRPGLSVDVKRRAETKPGIARRSGTCFSSYQRLRSSTSLSATSISTTNTARAPAWSLMPPLQHRPSWEGEPAVVRPLAPKRFASEGGALTGDLVAGERRRGRDVEGRHAAV